MHNIPKVFTVLFLTLIFTITLFAASINLDFGIIPCSVTTNIKGGVVPRIDLDSLGNTVVDHEKLNKLIVPFYTFETMCTPGNLILTPIDYEYGRLESFNIISVSVLLAYPLVIGLILFWVVNKILKK